MNIHIEYLKLYILVNNVHMEGFMPQIIDIGPSFLLMKCRKLSAKQHQELPIL